MTVDGAGSTWTNSSDLTVGVSGTGTLTIRNGGSVSDASGFIGNFPLSTGSTVTVDGAGSTWTNSSNLVVGIGGAGTLTVQNGGSVSAPNVSIALVAGSTGTLNIGAALGQPAVAPGTLTTPTIAFGAGSGQIVFNHTASNYVFAPRISGAGSVRVEAGTTILTATNTYTGPTTIDGGTLVVDGSIASSLTTVNAGGTLAGTGAVGSTTVGSGGALLGGNGTAGTSLAISGNLAFQSGALYLVALNPATASSVNVTGTATLGGATVNAIFAPGSYISKHHTILSASGGVSGTFAPSTVNSNLPANFHTALSYDATHAYLDLILDFAIPGNLNGNQQAVGNALTNYFNSNGSIPVTYAALSAAGLSQASGELGTGAQQPTFNAMGLFLGLLTDPFLDRGSESAPVSAAPGYAEESESAMAYAAKKRSTAEREAYAMFTKAPPATFTQRWSVWASGFGGTQRTDGNTVMGSNNTTSSIFGTAVGADYLLSPRTIAGFALAGGGTNFSVTGFGSGRSDLFQAGAYVRHVAGASYISAALAYGWQDITTNRTVTIAGVDQLRAQFNANAWSGRVEGGYRFVAPWIGGIGLTPYAAAQFTTFDLPAYAESVVSGAGTFALAYGAKSVTDTRTELGLRNDKSFARSDGIVTLRGRLAWAHDFNPDRAAAATFQALPGASFVVNGARQAPDSALVTASAEMRWLNGWSAAATFEGEFSNVTQSYAGKGVLRYQR
ncbi:autotransporter domain-containing protein [Bradyrhizobium guangdongense]|nr:autotransporter domain-containing protein [Bradyrhizobium guangdongense]